MPPDLKAAIVQDAESGRGEDGAFQAMRSVFPENDPRRPCRLCEMIRHFVEKTLNPDRRFQGSKFAEFSWSPHWQIRPNTLKN
jgi:hypothetical protein